MDGDVPESVDGDVKPDVKLDPDQGGEQPKKKAAPRTPSHELHIYSADELAVFKKREMVADAELLDGRPVSRTLVVFN